ncbi:hypothetical protein N7466_011420 [Penicillium verhagenii]|uniref:uncharacterized protein n=1 Tax=Penicillium verhagenii TaxID=1562060 RepID=UPI00254540A1|nr:uncharacterized protein N7466_011420 [Penicillium verhagenii]KAJ5915487.1 hypothetical protein N7466_011420 [Penicillium verhagenii]
MEFHSMSEQWELGGSPKFLNTHVILRDASNYYSAQVPERITHPVDMPSISNHPSLKKILPEHIFPKTESDFTICPNPENPSVFTKRPRLTGYDGSACLSLWVLREAQICELLFDTTHENVARYLGCTVENGRITGLCFERYEETLEDRIADGRWVDRENCLRQIEAGLEHLHSFGVVHNDMRLDNVMFKDRHEDVPVIIDFDSCAMEGCPLPDKRRLLPDGYCTAEFRNDRFGLDKLREELGMGGHCNDFIDQ